MTQNLTGRAAAAAASMGQRAAAAGVGLCPACRHPVRLHGDHGCAKGECFCSSTGAELRSGAPVEASPVAPPSAAELELLDARCACGHRRTEHNVTGSHVVCSVCACRGFTAPTVELEVPDAPVAPPAEPTPPPAVVAAPAPAAPPTAAPEPVREQPAAVAEVPPWLPGAGVPYVKPARVVEVTTPDEDVARQVDEVIAEGKATAGRLYARRSSRHTSTRPAAPTAQGSRAVVGEGDAVEEVAAAAVDEPAAVTAEPLDLTPLLGAALHCYSAWYCARCYQRRFDPGGCPDCGRALVPVHVVIAPREIS